MEIVKGGFRRSNPRPLTSDPFSYGGPETKRNMNQEFSTSATDGAIIFKLVHSGWHAAAGKGDRSWQPMFCF